MCAGFVSDMPIINIIVHCYTAWPHSIGHALGLKFEQCRQIVVRHLDHRDSNLRVATIRAYYSNLRSICISYHLNVVMCLAWASNLRGEFLPNVFLKAYQSVSSQI